MTGLPNVSAKSILCRTRLSPPTLHQHDDASTHHDKNDDGGKRFYRGQGLVPVVPKLKHALTSIESARPALSSLLVGRGAIVPFWPAYRTAGVAGGYIVRPAYSVQRRYNVSRPATRQVPFELRYLSGSENTVSWPPSAV